MIVHLGRGSFTVPASGAGGWEQDSYAGYAVLIGSGTLCVWRKATVPGTVARKKLAATLTEETAPVRCDIIYGPAGWRNFRREPLPS